MKCEHCEKSLKIGDHYIKYFSERFCDGCYESYSVESFFIGGEFLATDYEGVEQYSNWDEEDIPDDDTRISKNTITIFHNQNEIAVAEMTADAGNGGYYYSVGSMVIGDCYYPFVEA